MKTIFVASLLFASCSLLESGTPPNPVTRPSDAGAGTGLTMGCTCPPGMRIDECVANCPMARRPLKAP